VHTKHGDPMEFLTFEDDTGLIETVFFPKAYRRFCAVLDRSRPFVLHGKVDVDFGAVSLSVNRVEPLAVRGKAKRARWTMDDRFARTMEEAGPSAAEGPGTSFP